MRVKAKTEKNCLICNKIFIAYQKTQKFCGGMHYKFCAYCGDKFDVRCDKFFANRKTCSESCKRMLVSESVKKDWQRPEYRERVIQGNIKSWNTGDRRDNYSTFSKNLWQQESHRNRMRSVSADNMRKISKKLWSDPEYRKIKSAENAKNLAKYHLKNMAEFYVIDFGDFVKIGIHKNDRRTKVVKQNLKNYKSNDMKVFIMPATTAIDLEYNIAMSFDKFDTGIDFDGHTECYAIKNKENIIDTIQSTLKGML